MAKQWMFPACVALTLVGCWLLLASPMGGLNWSAGLALMGAVALAFHTVNQMAPGSEDTASPEEWGAWVGLGFMTLLLGYFATHLGKDTSVLGLNAVTRNLIMLQLAWTVVNHLLTQRWKTQSDERGRLIQAKGVDYSRTTLIIGVLILAFSPLATLEAISYPRLANLLIAVVMFAHWVEYLVVGVMHWKDRH